MTLLRRDECFGSNKTDTSANFIFLFHFLVNEIFLVLVEENEEQSVLYVCITFFG